MRRKFIYVLLFCFIGCFSFIGCAPPNQKSIDNQNKVVSRNGQLRIEGTKLLNEHGDIVVLEGMSLFWSQWMGKYYNEDCINWLAYDFSCDVIRAALGDKPDGYLKHPAREMKKIKTVIDACIKSDIYVIVDWHSHAAEDNTDAAVDFFKQIATEYGDKPNIIYEIYNEPLEVSWDTVIKPYAERVIGAIRVMDTSNVIIVGTPRWSQNVDEAAKNPIEGNNIAYAFHFYASTHKQELRDKCEVAIDSGLALWASEIGTCFSDGDGTINYEELETWFSFMEENDISWCNWSVADKRETASILKKYRGSKGGWKEKSFTESGKYIRERIRN